MTKHKSIASCSEFSSSRRLKRSSVVASGTPSPQPTNARTARESHSASSVASSERLNQHCTMYMRSSVSVGQGWRPRPPPRGRWGSTSATRSAQGVTVFDNL